MLSNWVLSFFFRPSV